MVLVQSHNLSKLDLGSTLISSYGPGPICLHGLENQLNFLSGENFDVDLLFSTLATLQTNTLNLNSNTQQ